ncbi:MAG: hypothetical protein JWO13_3619 [Acidobacteriales bacterium]|nr:hypothetical protein [Terriglobales bacterium]
MVKLIKLLIALALIVSVLMIVAPRLWVKNKKSLLTYNGHISEQIKLFHGKNGALLFYLPEQDSNGAYIYTSQNGLWRCDADSFIALKLIALSILNPAGCSASSTGTAIAPFSAQPQSLEFKLHNIPVVVSWQAPPR